MQRKPWGNRKATQKFTQQNFRTWVDQNRLSPLIWHTCKSSYPHKLWVPEMKQIRRNANYTDKLRAMFPKCIAAHRSAINLED